MVELHLSGRWLSGSPIIWILLALRVNICREFYKTNLPWNYRLLDHIQCSVTVSRISNQAWSKGSDAGVHCT